MVSPLDFLRSNWEKAKLFGFFLVMIATSGPLALMMGRAWKTAYLSHTVFALLSHYVGVTLQVFSILALGFFLGLLVLTTLDPKKRWQGILLWIGFLVSLVGLSSLGLFVQNVHVLQHIPWFAGGLVLGLVAGGGRQLIQERTAEALEFRRAINGIFYVISFLVVIAFLEYHVQYPNFLRVTQQGVQLVSAAGPSLGLQLNSVGRDIAVSAIFLATLREFVQYDAEKQFFVLGPRGSGKSLFLIGAYREALERAESRSENAPLNPSNDLMKMVEQLDMDTSTWVVEATAQGEMKDLRFSYIHGRIFPKNIELSSLDYAGEYLSRLPDALTGLLENEEDQTLLALAENVFSADTLILVIDVERFVNNEPLDISEYFSILQAADDKEIYLVATKADILAERFQDEQGVEAHRYYDEFTMYVNNELQSSEQIRALYEETAGAEIHPVYYQTKKAEHGDGRLPMRDERGSVMTVGFDRLLDKLGS